jgi:hypothetical protein
LDGDFLHISLARGTCAGSPQRNNNASTAIKGGQGGEN